MDSSKITKEQVNEQIKMWEEFFPNGKIYGIDNGWIVPNSNITVGINNELPSIDDVKLLALEAVANNANMKWLENERIKCFAKNRERADAWNIPT